MGVLEQSINSKYGDDVNITDTIRTLLKKHNVPKIAAMLNVNGETIRRFCTKKSIPYHKETKHQKADIRKTEVLDGVVFFWCIDCGNRPLSLKARNSELCTRCAKNRNRERV